MEKPIRVTRTRDLEENVTITRELLPGKSEDGKLKPGEFRLFGSVVMPPQSSIHPRVVNGCTRYEKVNTAKAKRN